MRLADSEYQEGFWPRIKHGLNTDEEEISGDRIQKTGVTRIARIFTNYFEVIAA
jgi:hypothetical protein